jgi:hypothetical protein
MVEFAENWSNFPNFSSTETSLSEIIMYGQCYDMNFPNFQQKFICNIIATCFKNLFHDVSMSDKIN